MNTQLTDLQRVLQVGNTITPEQAQRAAVALDGVGKTFRMAARQIGKTFAMLCETFATVDMEQLPAQLRDQIEAVVLGRDLPPSDTTGPVTPIELLQIAHRMTAVGDYDTASRLRRLADDLVAKPSDQAAKVSSSGWTFRRKNTRTIVVTAPDGSGVQITNKDDSIAGVVLWELAQSIISAEGGAP